MSVRITKIFHKFSGAPHPIIDIQSPFEFTKNKFNVISTPSGWGKTTLFRLMSGWFDVNENTLIDANYNPSADVFFIGNHQTLLPWKTVRQNLLMYSDGKISERVLINSLGNLGLEESILGKFPYQLSLGMYKRVELVCSKIAGKHLIILDEFFASLDFESREQAHDLLTKNEDCVYLLSSHHPDSLPFDSVSQFSVERDEVTGTIKNVILC